MGKSIVNLRHKTTVFANTKLTLPFEWGKNDCNTLAFDFIDDALPGINYLTDKVKGKYSTRFEARKFYREFEWRWEDYLISIGFVKVPLLYFQPGDLHMHKMGRSLEAISINLGSENIIADPKHGICLKSFFELYEDYDLTAYRYKE
jgi:hypothetical protein